MLYIPSPIRLLVPPAPWVSPTQLVETLQCWLGEDGICVECGGGDYALLITVGIITCVCIALLYLASELNVASKIKAKALSLQCPNGAMQVIMHGEQWWFLTKFFLVVYGGLMFSFPDRSIISFYFPLSIIGFFQGHLGYRRHAKLAIWFFYIFSFCSSFADGNMIRLIQILHVQILQLSTVSTEVLMNEGQKSRQPGAVPSTGPAGPTLPTATVPLVRVASEAAFWLLPWAWARWWPPFSHLKGSGGWKFLNLGWRTRPRYPRYPNRLILLSEQSNTNTVELQSCMIWYWHMLKSTWRSFFLGKPVVPIVSHVFFPCLWPKEDPTFGNLRQDLNLNHSAILCQATHSHSAVQNRVGRTFRGDFAVVGGGAWGGRWILNVWHRLTA